MGKPVDRIEGVQLVTDYGALDRALQIKAEKEAKYEGELAEEQADPEEFKDDA